MHFAAQNKFFAFGSACSQANKETELTVECFPALIGWPRYFLLSYWLRAHKLKYAAIPDEIIIIISFFISESFGQNFGRASVLIA